MPAISQKFDGKKFMWDGIAYESEEKAKETMMAYQKNRFEVKLIQDGKQYFVYSRRDVLSVEVVAECTAT